MRIDASGNLGIAQTSPSGELHVGNTTSGGDTDVYIQSPSTDRPRLRLWGGTTNKLELSVGSTAEINSVTSGVPMTFFTANSERMRIDSSGFVIIGNTSRTGSAKFETYQSANEEGMTITAANASYSNNALVVYVSRNTTDNSFRAFNYFNLGASASRFIIADSGNATNTNGSYGTISDAKLKENITDATSKLDKVNQLRVRNYNLIGSELKQIGFVAQEFEQVFPSMVEESPDTDKDNNNLGTTTKTIKTTVLIPILVKAIQEQQALIENLTTRLNALEGK
jgi:hypothetical protein